LERQKKSFFLRIGLIGASLPLLIIMFCAAWATIPREDGIVNVTPEQIAFFVARYLSIPLGLFCLIVTQRVYTLHWVNRRVLALGMFLGTFNVLLGVVAWVLNFMMMEFGSHH